MIGVASTTMLLQRLIINIGIVILGWTLIGVDTVSQTCLINLLDLQVPTCTLGHSIEISNNFDSFSRRLLISQLNRYLLHIWLNLLLWKQVKYAALQLVFTITLWVDYLVILSWSNIDCFEIRTSLIYNQILILHQVIFLVTTFVIFLTRRRILNPMKILQRYPLLGLWGRILHWQLLIHLLSLVTTSLICHVKRHSKIPLR